MSRYVFYIMLTLSLTSLPFVARAHQSPAGQEGMAAPQSISKSTRGVETAFSLGASNPTKVGSGIKKNKK
jgi:hypothetical protein